MAGKPKPTRFKVLTGNPGKRPIPEEFHVESELPQPPSHLDAYALEEWNRLAPGLHACGLLFEADRASFAAYCTAYGTYRICQEEMQKRADNAVDKQGNKIGWLAGLVSVTKAGNIIQNTLVGTRNTAMRDMVRYASEFGLTPSARARLAVDPGRAKQSKFSGLIGGKKHE